MTFTQAEKDAMAAAVRSVQDAKPCIADFEKSGDDPAPARTLLYFKGGKIVEEEKGTFDQTAKDQKDLDDAKKSFEVDDTDQKMTDAEKELIEKGKRFSEFMEAVWVKKGGFMFPNAEILPVSDFTDVRQGIDAVLVIRNDDRSIRQLIGFDLTYADDEQELKVKLAKHMAEVSQGTLGNVRYLKIDGKNYEAGLIPKVVVPFSDKSVRQVAAAWARNDNLEFSDSARSREVIRLIDAQLAMQRDVAENIPDSAFTAFRPFSKPRNAVQKRERRADMLASLDAARSYISSLRQPGASPDERVNDVALKTMHRLVIDQVDSTRNAAVVDGLEILSERKRKQEEREAAQRTIMTNTEGTRPSVKEVVRTFQQSAPGANDLSAPGRMYTIHFNDPAIPPVELRHEELEAAGIHTAADTIQPGHASYDRLIEAAYRKRDGIPLTVDAVTDDADALDDADDAAPVEEIRRQKAELEEQIRRLEQGLSDVNAEQGSTGERIARKREELERLRAWEAEKERLIRKKAEEAAAEGGGGGAEEEHKDSHGHGEPWHLPRNAGEWGWFAAAVATGSWYAARFFFKNVGHPILHSIGFVITGDEKHPWQTLFKNTEAEFMKALKMKGGGGGSSHGPSHGGGHGGH